jgi:hypothetical protein
MGNILYKDIPISAASHNSLSHASAYIITQCRTFVVSVGPLEGAGAPVKAQASFVKSLPKVDGELVCSRLPDRVEERLGYRSAATP